MNMSRLLGAVCTSVFILISRLSQLTNHLQGRAKVPVLAVLCLTAGVASAVPMYDTGVLNFSTTDQSMWGAGAAFQLSDSKFFGAQWSDETMTIGGIVGSLDSTIVNTNPAWWVWKGCKETVNFLCGSQPSTGAREIVTDSRTGAKVDLTTSGKFGFEFGYTVDAGSVAASVEYSAAADVPLKALQGEFFNLNPNSTLEDGSISSQSPTAKAYMNAIAELSGSVTAKGCLIFTGCVGGSANLLNINGNLPLLAIDPNALEVLPNLLPDLSGVPRQAPLASVALFNQELTLAGSLDVTGIPGFKLESNFGTIADSNPNIVPSIEIDLASLSVQVPEITTSGGLDGGVIKSNGRDDFLSLKADIDGIAAMSGTMPPLGLGVTLIDVGGLKVSTKLDALDIDMGPDLGITQDFELDPTLMVKFAFSAPVMITGGLASMWEGQWDMLPDIALFETTTFTPTFWIDTLLSNTIGIDLGLSGTLDLFKFSFAASLGGVNLLGTSPVSLNSLFGLGNTLFETPKAKFPIWDTGFALGGFNEIQAAPFTINVQEAVPEPGTLLLLLVGLGTVVLMRRHNRVVSTANPSGYA